MTWQKLIQLYITHLESLGRSYGTIKTYKVYFSHLRRCKPAPGRVTTEDIERVMSNPAWSPEARKSARTAARGLFSFACQRGYLQYDPAEDIGTVRVPFRCARPVPDPVIRTALQKARPREALMIRLAAYCGLRANEIAKVHGRDFDGRLLYVHGKGGKERVVPVLDIQLQDALRSCEGFLFPGGVDGHLGGDYISKLVSKALPDGYTCHMLRHRLATSAYAGTRDLLAVQEILGHARPETTRRYVQLPADATEAAILAASVLSA